jgi:transposase
MPETNQTQAVHLPGFTQASIMKMNMTVMREIYRLICTTLFSNRAIGKNLGISHNTVKRMREIAHTATLDWKTIQEMTDTELKKLAYPKKQNRYIKRNPDWALTYALMQRKHQLLLQLWEEYRLINPGDAYSYSQFTFHFRGYKQTIDVTMRMVHIAGECVFVDFAGTTITWTDTETGAVHNAWIFIAVSGASNYTFVFAVRSQSSEDWIAAHNAMFQFFGGVPEVLVPDNLKAAVTKPGMFPSINRSYLAMAQHYGCVIDPARIRKPQDKPKAESGVKYGSRWIISVLRRCQFFSIDEINEAIAELLPALNEREFRKLPGCRHSRFVDIDQPAFRPLPAEPFVHTTWVSEQKVGRDYHVYVLDHAYSVPFHLVSKMVEARYTHNTVEIFHDNRPCAVHVRSFAQGMHTTDKNHMPDHHRSYSESTLEHFLHWAKGIGVHAELAVSAQFEGRPEYSHVAAKACRQLQYLARVHSHARFETACERAVLLQSKTVKSIRSILQRRLDEIERPDTILQDIPLHANVRGPEYYAGDAASW